MTMEEIENMKNFGPQVSGCLAKPPPTLSEPNPCLPCARADVKIKYHPDKGRYLVAEKDVGPGEMLLVEKPYSSVLLPEFYSSHCQTCYQRVLAAMPCWCCSKVRFCSDECRSELSSFIFTKQQVVHL